MLSSPVDIAILLGIGLLFFGPKKFPEIGRALGQGLGNFKKSLKESQEEFISALGAEDQASPPAVKSLEKKDAAAARDSAGDT